LYEISSYGVLVGGGMVSGLSYGAAIG
jgi:hypothetical protein